MGEVGGVEVVERSRRELGEEREGREGTDGVLLGGGNVAKPFLEEVVVVVVADVEGEDFGI